MVHTILSTVVLHGLHQTMETVKYEALHHLLQIKVLSDGMIIVQVILMQLFHHLIACKNS